MPNDYLKEEEFEEVKEIKEAPKLSIKSQFKNAKSRTRFLTRVGMFTALSVVFYCYLKFPITPPFPSFLEVNFSNLFVLLGSLFTGPIGGIIIVLLRFVFKIILVPTWTSYIGELTDVFLSLMVMLPASLTYMFIHTKKGGFLGILLSFVSWLIFSLIINWLISFPMYYSLLEQKQPGSMLNMLQTVNSDITSENMLRIYLFLMVLPFNAISGALNVGLAAIVYKKLSIILKKLGI